MVDHPLQKALATLKSRPVRATNSFAAVFSEAYPVDLSSSSFVIWGSKLAISLSLLLELVHLFLVLIANCLRSFHLLILL